MAVIDRNPHRTHKQLFTERGTGPKIVLHEALNEDDAGNPVDPSRDGLARELARMNLPINTYTQWYWKTDLHNLLHFLSLRADPPAQYEIRAYADVMLDSVRRWVPIAADAFEEYRLGGASLSRSAIDVVRRMVAGEEVSQEQSGMSAREWRELRDVLRKSD